MADYTELLESKNIDFLRDEPLSGHSTFRIGGKADFFVRPKSETELAYVLKSANDCGVCFYVLGNGSNILFTDKGFRGAVVSLVRMKEVTVAENKLTAECGASLSSVSAAAQKASLDGVRFLYGIPGSVGGGVYMNAGAYGGEIGSVVKSVRYYDADKNDFFVLDNADCAFSYRHTAFMEHPEWVITSATLELREGNADEIKAEMDDLMERRRSKQPLEYPSAGSVFKRCEGYFTAKLIDEAGLKGTSVGLAAVSEKHAGFIINKGGATAHDVLALVDIIKNRLFELHGINIECEIRIVGEK